jgi:hypothetical protein
MENLSCVCLLAVIENTEIYTWNKRDDMKLFQFGQGLFFIFFFFNEGRAKQNIKIFINSTFDVHYR